MSTAGSRPLTLKPLQVAGFFGSIPLQADVVLLGRAAENDVVLAGDAFPSVSTHHARLEWRGPELWLKDQGSKNGTLVNGEHSTETRLVAGDVLRLGPIGPRFLVAAQGGLEETAFIDAAKLRPGIAAAGRSEARLRKLLDSRTRKALAMALGLALLLIAGLVVFEWKVISDRAEVDSLRAAELARAQMVIEEMSQRQAETAKTYASAEAERNLREASLRKDLERFTANKEASKEALAKRLSLLEAEGSVSHKNQALISELRQELEGTRGELADARRQVKMLNPVNLEASRLSEVTRVRAAVVLIESKTELVLDTTDQVLHVESTLSGPEPNFEDLGSVYTIDSTGSGFCVSADGWILTNAHVVAPPKDHPLLKQLSELPISIRQTFYAVFSGTDQRHPLRVERLADPGTDLALTHVAPFEGMPFLDGLDLDQDAPTPGSDVFLFGFPLGNFALQEGERVIASTFRGILSRQVDGVLQVDAGVHPGNSGGPITDSHGRVIGVVFSVQALPDQTAVFTIGYGVPIRDVSQLWPPPAQASMPFSMPGSVPMPGDEQEGDGPKDPGSDPSQSIDATGEFAEPKQQ